MLFQFFIPTFSKYLVPFCRMKGIRKWREEGRKKEKKKREEIFRMKGIRKRRGENREGRKKGKKFRIFSLDRIVINNSKEMASSLLQIRFSRAEKCYSNFFQISNSITSCRKRRGDRAGRKKRKGRESEQRDSSRISMAKWPSYLNCCVAESISLPP